MRDLEGGVLVRGDRAPTNDSAETDAQLREHSLRGCCRSKSNEQRCMACGKTPSDLNARDMCFGCGHLICARHSHWPTRKHSPEDHGPGGRFNPRGA